MLCRALVDAYPESLKEETRNGHLPIHVACDQDRNRSRIDVIQYILEEYPESINIRDRQGYFPIHYSALIGNAKTIELLLKHDATAAVKETANGSLRLPLHLSSLGSDSNACQVLFDSYPEAINIRNAGGKVPLDLAREEGNQEVVNFLQTQLVYVKQAQDTAAISTPDSEGYLPLHHALIKGDASLGSIKLLVRGYPAVLQKTNQPHGGVMEETSTSGVSKVNANDKLPFHLLLEHEDEQVRTTLEFTEACFQLLRAHPETVMIMQTASRKRKRD